MSSQLDRLKTVLNVTGLASRDNRLYQVLNTLLGIVGEIEEDVEVLNATAVTNSTTATNAITQLTGHVFATGPGSVVSTLSTTGVTAGAYGSSTAIPIITVNQYGRLTAATTVSVSSTVAGITQLTGDVLAGPGSGSVVSTLSTTGVVAGTYGGTLTIPIITVDAKGRVTTATTTTFTTGGGAAGNFTFITTANPAGSTTVSFTNFSSYKQLQFYIYARSTRAAVNAEDVQVRINNIATGQYYTELLFNSTSTAAAAFQILAATSGTIAIMPGTTAPTGVYGSAVVTMNNVNNIVGSKQLICENHLVVATTNAGILTRHWGVTSLDTNAVTTVTFFYAVGSFSVDSTIDVYGISA